MATTDNTENKLPGGDAAGGVWRGYTIDELKYRRAVALVKLEMQKGRLAESFNATTGALAETRSKILGGGGGKRFAGKLKYINYLIIGYKSVRTAIGLWRSFKGKKR